MSETLSNFRRYCIISIEIEGINFPFNGYVRLSNKEYDDLVNTLNRLKVMRLDLRTMLLERMY